MSVVLKLDTTKSLFEPIEIEVDGTRLRVKRITLDDLEHIQALQERASAGSAAAIRESVSALLEGDVSIIGKLRLDQVAELIATVVERSVKPSAEEKNSSGPGDKS